MLCTLNEVLPHARKNHYAVTAFDYDHDVYVRPILEICEEKRAPVIMQALPPDLEGRGMYYMAGIIKSVANAYTVPIVMHLDHAESFDLIKRCIKHGFSSVMFDGSHLPFAENIRQTREVVDYAHARGVTVEAELGFVAGTDIGGGDTGDSRLTEPKEVEEFVEKTGVDALAISIGTAHGVYKSAPVLDIKRLAEIMAVTDVPLVLHGGSGTPEDQLTQAIKGGITKLNIYADLRLGMNSQLPAVSAAIDKRKDEVPDRVLAPFCKGVRDVALEKIELTMSTGRY